MPRSTTVLVATRASRAYGFALALVLLAGLSSPRAEACSCAPPQSPQQAVAQADAVFLGNVVMLSLGSSGVYAVLEVEEWWKGAGGRYAVVVTNEPGPSCGFSFRLGMPYLVYGQRDSRKVDALGVPRVEAVYATNTCARTRSIVEEDPLEDLSVLGTLKPRPGAGKGDAGTR